MAIYFAVLESNRGVGRYRSLGVAIAQDHEVHAYRNIGVCAGGEILSAGTIRIEHHRYDEKQPRGDSQTRRLFEQTLRPRHERQV